MIAPQLTDLTRDLVREFAAALLRTEDEWLTDLTADAMKASGMESTAADPVLRAASERAFRESFLFWATENLRNPGAPVPPALGEKTVRIARDLIRRGLEESALAAYRAGQAQALRACVDVAFAVADDRDELKDLLDVVTWSIGDFVESTVTAAWELMREERAAVLRGSQPELRQTVALLVEGAPISKQRAEARLGYRLGQQHTAVVVWSAEADLDIRAVDEVVEAIGAGRPGRPLVVMPGASTKWVWFPGNVDLDRERVHAAVDPAGPVRIAVGGRAGDTDGFRRSHLDAVAAQRMVAGLESPQRVVFFDDVHLVALMTADADGAEQFVRRTLGGLVEASTEVRETVLAYVEESGSVQRVAARLYAHRNTVVRRVARAEALLPRPLAEHPVQVATALQVLRWTRPQGRST